MSIINSQPLIGASGQGGYFLTKSLRFRSSATAYLSRTPASAGNRRTWTYSIWFKQGALNTCAPFLGYWQNATIYNSELFLESTQNDATRQLKFYDYDGTSQFSFATTQSFRDVSAWYHLVVAFDSTQATSTNRVKIYLNGSQITSFSSAIYPSQNFQCNVFNNNVLNWIGYNAAFGGGNAYDGYLAEVNFIDGQALTPSSFGETSTSTGVWIPKKYTGTYGTNGFYLPFTDVATTSGSNAGLGKDFSGNGNYWTTNNISVTSGSTYDSMKDVPTLTDTDTANYAVLNPLVKFYGGTASSIVDGNLRFVSNTSGVTESAFATQAMKSGKWYAEVLIAATATGQWIGVCTTTAFRESAYIGVRNPGYAYRVSSGNKCNNDNTGVAYAASSTTNDIIGIAMDADAGSITFYKNGVSLGVAFTSMTNDGNGWVFGGDSDPGGTLIFNFGQRPFAYTPPTGFVALNTFNLPTPTIGATASSQANKYFDATTYTGNGSTQSIVNSGSMQPSLVWAKQRNGTAYHALFDSVRGATLVLQSNTTTAEQTFSTALTSFNSNGFTSGSSTDTNQNGQSYVAWQWAGNGSGSTNTAGSITSTVSANTTAGFSIVTYTGNGTQPSTVGHGLGVAPKMIFVKSRSNGGTYYDWAVYNSDIGAGNAMLLNSTSGSFSKPSYWNSTTATSTVFTLGSDITVNQSSATYVAYCFAQVAGYSAFGSYTGNGSSDGVFIYTGFRPRFVMYKNASYAGTSWAMLDSSRNTYNVLNARLFADGSDAENTATTPMDFTSNGFKVRSTNDGVNRNGDTIIYMAFAESPFKYSLAR